ncbi:uncharacterized protein LOC141906507 isoform X1 [Tubulanus polymorphus]|uniref:uncharacterized protein LOC141906507 isoform X1 n=1 Tax=Tubulanus polymorphus TaxID=672921 RepID=UPI003DA684D6
MGCLWSSKPNQYIQVQQTEFQATGVQIDEVQETEVLETVVCETEVLENEVQEKVRGTELQQTGLQRTEVQESKTLETEVHESKVLENEVHESKVLENEVHESKFLENEVHESKVLETEVHESKVLETEVHESKVLETEVLETKVQENAVQGTEDELFKKIKNRNSSQSEEDDGYPQSPTSSTPTADNSYIEHAITMSRRNESGCESLNSVNSSEMEYDLTSRQQSGFNRKSKSQSMSSVDSSDFEGIELSESLDSSILRHKIQVRPKSRRKSSNMRRAASLSQSNLDTLDEETGSATVTSTAKITQDASLDDSVFMSRSLEEKRNPEDEKTMTTTPPPPPAARESVEKMDESNNNKNTEKIAKNHNQFVKATDNKIETDSESVIDEPKRPIRKIGLPACFQQERQIAAQPIEKPRSKTVPVNPDVEPELTDRPKSFSGPATAAAPPVVKSSPTNQIDNKPTTTKSSFSVESGNNNNNEPSWIALARKKQPSTNRRDEMITDSLQNEPKLENTAATAATAATVAPPAVKVSTAKLAAKFQMMSTTNQPAAAVVTRRDDKKEISSVPKPIPSNLEPTDSSSCNNRKVLDLVKNYQKLQVN